MCFSADGQYVAGVHNFGLVEIWDLASGQLVQSFQRGPQANWVDFSPDSERLATAGNDFTAQVCDVKSARPVLPPLRHRSGVNRVRYSPDGRLLATASYDHTARIWDAATGQAVSPPLWHDGNVADIIFSPDGQRVATASFDRTACIWMLHQDNRPVQDLQLWSELHTGERMSAKGVAVKLSAGELHEIWQTLRQQYPQDFALPLETKAAR
jgi:WD40 repeat protein